MTYRKVLSTTEIPIGESRRIEVDGEAVAVFNVDGVFYAIGDECTHGRASLSEGTVDRGMVVCPSHGARFDLKTGRPKSLPAVTPVRVYPVRIEGTDLEVAID